MYKILSWNVNGLRSCLRNGFEDQIWRLDCDVICLQEVKLSDTDILEEMLPDGYAYVDHLSSNKGRNGVVVFSRLQPKAVYKRMGLKEFDAQGRFLRIDFEDFILINLYMPHGGRDKKTLGFKLEAYEWLKKRMENLADKPVVLAGDFNIAAEDIDVCRAGQNRNNIMFTSEERQLICDMKQLGYVDVFRKLYPDKMAYTWWSYAFQCRERNIGWRIDYFWTTKEMFQYVECVEVLEQIKGSDHCPIMLRMYGGKEDEEYN